MVLINAYCIEHGVVGVLFDPWLDGKDSSRIYKQRCPKCGESVIYLSFNQVRIKNGRAEDSHSE